VATQEDQRPVCPAVAGLLRLPPAPGRRRTAMAVAGFGSPRRLAR